MKYCVAKEQGETSKNRSHFLKLSGENSTVFFLFVLT